MAADGARLPRDRAPQACLTCKTRKKKCTKSLPSCEYCIRKELGCVYAFGLSPRANAVSTGQGSRDMTSQEMWPHRSNFARAILPARESLNLTTSVAYQSQVCFEVHRLIRSTGQFVDDISARYFQHFHRQLPVISRSLFNNSLLTLGAPPAADVSVLLLSMCLIIYAPALEYQPENGVTGPTERQSLYLATRSLIAQTQVSQPPSLPLIQASLLLAVYEYINGNPEHALVTMAGTVRMAYVTRMHSPGSQQLQTRLAASPASNANFLLQQSEEVANTWWGIIIYERIFLSDVTVSDQPLFTTFPDGNSRLPIEAQALDQLDVLDLGSLPNIQLSCLMSSRVGGFGRTAQATCLLDQVHKVLRTPAIDSRLLQLDSLDTSIQSFLSLVMPSCVGQRGTFCTAANIAIKTLFILHWNILDEQPQAVTANLVPLEEWQKRSEAALETVTKIVVEIADTLIDGCVVGKLTRLMDDMPPTYPYIARAALRHIDREPQRANVNWPTSAKGVLRASLDAYLERWGTRNDCAGAT